MPKYKVVCGDMQETVEADSHEDAAAKLFTMFDDPATKPPDIGYAISTIEVIGDEIIGDELWHETIQAIKRAGRWEVYTDAASVENSSPNNQTSSG